MRFAMLVHGGLGPTKDDITKTTLAHYFEDTLVYDDARLAFFIPLLEPQAA